jgi:proline- and glutamine-rich splicing factor
MNAGSMRGSNMKMSALGRETGPVGGQGPRGMWPGTPAGYDRGREEYEDPQQQNF